MLSRGDCGALVPAGSCRPVRACNAEGEVWRKVESRLGDRSSSSSLESAFGPSCLVGVLGAAPLKLGRGGDLVDAKLLAVDRRESGEDPLRCNELSKVRQSTELPPSIASSIMHG